MEGKCEDWVMVETGGGKNVENVDFTSKVCGEEDFKEVKLSLLEIWNVTSWIDIRAISNVVFFAPLSISSILGIYVSVREKFRFSSNEIPF